MHARYGLRDIALRTLELMTGALLQVTAGPPREESREKARARWSSCMKTESS